MKGKLEVGKKGTNVLLVKAIKKKFGSVAELCRRWRYKSPSEISNLINLKKSPIKDNGEFTSIALLLSGALDILTDKLFPLKLYKKVLPRGIWVASFYPLSIDIKKELKDISDIVNPITTAQQDFLMSRISSVLKSLSYREREIIKLRFGLDDGYSYTLEEVGNIFKLTRDRIRQIEARAVRKLQQSRNSDKLVGFLD